MASIPGIVYVAMGGIVTIVSLMMGDKFILFFYAGIAFLIFGGVISFIGSFQYHGARKTMEKHALRARQEIARRYPQVAQQHYGQRRFQNYKVCMRCKTPARLSDHFCNRCGSRI